MRTETSLFEKFKETGKHGIVFGTGATLQRLIAFVLIPIYTRHLTTSDYGLLGLISITGLVLLTISELGLSPALCRSYYDYNDEGNKRTVISTAFFLSVVIGCMSCVLGIFSTRYLSILLFGSEKYGVYLLIVVITVIVSNVRHIPLTILRVEKRSVRYVVFQISYSVVGITLIMYFVTINNWGVMGVLVGNLVAGLIFLIILFYCVRKEIVLRFSKPEAWKMIRYGAPIALVGLSAFVLTYADRYMLNYYCGLNEVGSYTLGYQFGMVILVGFSIPTKLIWTPMVLSAKDDSNAKDFYSKALTYVIFVGVSLFLVLSLLSKEVIQIVANKQYWNAYTVIPIITLGYLVWSTRSILEVGTIVRRKTKVRVWYFFIGAVTNIILNLFLIPKYGMRGAAHATLISFVVMIIVVYYYNRKVFEIDYEWMRILKMCSAAALTFAIGYSAVIDPLHVSIMVKIAVILSYPLILCLLRFYTKAEIQRMKQALRFIHLKLDLKHLLN